MTARPMTEEFGDEDMAAVGRALMEAIHDNREHPALAGWMPMDSPVEIVVDLLNELDEAKAALLSTSSAERGMREALELVRMSNGWRYMADETQAIVIAALAPDAQARPESNPSKEQ
jgi:hypothetical protein